MRGRAPCADPAGPAKRGAGYIDLNADEPDTVAVLQLATYLTTLMMNYRYTTRLRGEL